MVGKVTPDHQLSCSGLAIWDEHYPYGFTKNKLLDQCIRAGQFEDVRSKEQPLHMRIGDVLENPILEEACLRLGLTNPRLDIENPWCIVHCPLRVHPMGLPAPQWMLKNP
jgi:hypothetical protein